MGFLFKNLSNILIDYFVFPEILIKLFLRQESLDFKVNYNLPLNNYNYSNK